MMLPSENKKARRNIQFFMICMALSTLAYIVLIANELTNTYDGMWKGAYDTYYTWVVSIGRWFWPLVGKVRLDMSPEPFTTLLSLALMVAGGCIVVEWFEVRDSWKKYLIVLLTVINTSVCVRLSYRYMSPTFAISFFLSVFGIYIIRRGTKIWKEIISILCLTASLGCYQADLGCSCLLVLLNIIWLLQKEDSWKKTVHFVVSAAVAIVTSCILYKVIWDIVLKVNDISASNYHGADSISAISILVSFPETLLNTYKTFGKYFLTDTIKYNTYQEYEFFKIILLGVPLLWGFAGGVQLFRKSKHKLFLYGICLTLIPAAANIALIIAADTGSVLIQQTMPMAVVLPFVTAALEPESIIRKQAIRAICFVILSFILAGSFLMISVDQHVMLTSKESSISLINRVASELDYSDEPQNGYVFLGRVSENPLFRKDDLWQKSNSYARYGEFFIGSNGNTQSYDGLLRDAGLNLKINWKSTYWHELEDRDDIRAMPSFPAAGSIMKIDETLVIKLSDY